MQDRAASPQETPPPKPLAPARIQLAILVGGAIVLALGLLLAPRKAAPPARPPEAATPFLVEEPAPAPAIDLAAIGARAAPSTLLLPLPLRGVESPAVRDWVRGAEAAHPRLHGGVILDGGGLVVTSTAGLQQAVGIPVRLSDGRGAVAHLEVHDAAIGLGLLRLEDAGSVDSAIRAAAPPAAGDPVAAAIAVPGGPLLSLGRVVSTSPQSVLITGVPGDVVSGLPVFDTAGHLVAISGAASDGTTTAYRIDAILERADRLRQEGRALPSATGLSLQSASGALASRFDAGGLIVSDVVPASPADTAGIRPGDMLREVNGKPVPGAVDSAVAELSALPPGESAAFTLNRSGRSLTAAVTPVLLITERWSRAARPVTNASTASTLAPATALASAGIPADAQVLAVNGRAPGQSRRPLYGLYYVESEGRRYFAVVQEQSR